MSRLIGWHALWKESDAVSLFNRVLFAWNGEHARILYANAMIQNGERL